NIANVMGVFMPDNPFNDLSVFGLFSLTGTQQLFFLGAVAISVGVFTYSERVMGTVGGGLVNISPVAALVIVLAQSITLFLFASQGLEHFLASQGLPTIPLVPVSSSQAVIGAILGISLFKGAGMRYRVLGNISLGWLATPILAGVVAFFLLFFVDNVFDQQVSRTVHYRFDAAVVEELSRRGIEDPGLIQFQDRSITNAITLKKDLEKITNLGDDQVTMAMDLAHMGRWYIDSGVIAREVDAHWLTSDQLAALRTLVGQRYDHAWQFHQALAETSVEWRKRPPSTVNKMWNKELTKKLSFLDRVFTEDELNDEGG
ncbi:MAG: inorganic phosphate transporter, partial [Candidatus Krumholzibacteria bacterium]|nr:inorganic phosphate transporter [Candidatus Krumholzibacteria bacterium]